MDNREKTMEKIVSLCKNRGFIFAGSDIYGGLANAWDYGPLGVEFKNNVKRAWWEKFVRESAENVGLDSAILMNPQVWVASGHVGGFSDPLMDCKSCHGRFRADKLVDGYFQANGIDAGADGWSNEKLAEFIKEKKIPCPDCSARLSPTYANYLIQDLMGVTEDSTSEIYLVPRRRRAFRQLQKRGEKHAPQAAVRHSSDRQILPQ